MRKSGRSSSSQQRSGPSNAELYDDINEGESSSEPKDGSNVVRGEKRKALNSTVRRDAKRLKRTQSSINIGRSFGQKQPPLTDLLKNILQRYPDGGQILKELIQNADDAGAKEVKFLFNATSYGTDSLVSPGLASFQGPALYCYNNAEFTEEDWEGIQCLMRSNKQNKLLKVGRFGIGFNSVYHITDLPSIVSGTKVAFLDPHEKYFERGEPGREFSTADPLLKNHFDQFKPFHKIFDCNLNNYYSGTLFRFPLRTQASQLSTKIYTREMVNTLFDSLKNEASAILLFLKNVDSISLYEQKAQSKIVHVYTARVSENSKKEVRKKRQELIQDITVHWDFTIKTTFYQLEIEKEFPGKRFEKSKWFVANQVGTREKKLIELAQSLKLLPWIGIAFPIETIDMTCLGRIFCFLPLPPDGDCRTGLPVQVNGYFGLTDNRRALKWPGPDCQNDDTALWNRLLLQKVGSQVYANLIVSMVRDGSTNLPPELRAKFVYSALPDPTRVRQEWSCILQPFFKTILAMEIFLTTPRGNYRWINLGDAILDRLDETKGMRQEIKQVVLRTLLSAGIPIVSLPGRVIQIIDQFHQISGWVTVQKVTSALLCNVLRSNFDVHRLALSFEERLLVLEYALLNAPDLHGVPLLPLENRQFIKFSSNASVEKIFISSEKHSADLLPNMKHRLLYCNLPFQVQQKLHELGSLKATQLQHPTANDIKQLLWQNLPNDWSSHHPLQKETVTWDANTKGHPSLAWLKLMWKWINENYPGHLGEFEGTPLIPVSTNPASSMARLRQNSTVIVREHSLYKETLVLPDLVRELMLKSGSVVVEKLPSFVKHDQLFHYMSLPSPLGILTVLTVARDKVIQQISVASRKVKHQLCSIFSRLNRISSGQVSFIRTLPIFKSVGGSHFVSCETERGELRLVAPQNFSLPKNIEIVDETNILASKTDESYRLLKKLGMRIESTASLIKIHLKKFLGSSRIKDVEKDNVIFWILERMDALNQEQPGFIQFIRELACIPTAGGKRLAPNKLFDHSDRLLTRLLKGNNEAFPTDQFLEPIRRRKYELHIRRRENVTAQDVLLILNKTSAIGLGRGEALAELVNQRPQLLGERTADGRLLNGVLCEFPWLPRVQYPPTNYPDFMPWYGGMNVCRPSSMYSGATALLVGATVPVFNEILLSSEVQDLLGMSHPPNLCKEVIDQLHLAVGSWTNQTKTPSLILGKFEQMIKTIYMYLEQAPRDTVQHLLKSKCLTEWVWHGNGFTSPEKVALESHFPKTIDLHPYLFRLPNELFKVKDFLENYGVKPQFTDDDLLDILSGIKAKHDSGRRPSEDVMQDLDQCRAVLEWIVRSNGDLSEEHRSKLLIPVQSSSSKLQLEPCNTCTYCDREFLRRGVSEHGITIKSHLIHKAIPDYLASHLQVPRLSSCIAGAKAVGINFKEAGQYEPLTTRLRNILQQYKEGVTIFKEIIQNADDARASKVHFVIDWRESPRKRLLTEELAKCQGPALWAYNDAMFSEDDFENINKLAGETKKEDLDKVGRFGLGFNSVYHLTDVPSFVSGEHLVVFDPNMNHISKLIDGKMRGGGFMLSLADNKHVLSLYPDQFLPYNQLFGCDMSGEDTFHFKGTLFRLPFRTSEQAKDSAISKEPYSPHNVNNLVKSLKKSASNLLLFTQNVKEVRVFEILKNSNVKKSLLLPLISITKSIEKILYSNEADKCGKGTILRNSSTWLLNSRNSRISTWLLDSRNSRISVTSEGPRRGELLKIFVRMVKSYLCEVTQDIDMEEMWLVNSCAGGRSSLQVALSDDGLRNAVVPITGVAAKMRHSNKHGTRIHAVTGKVFCFMPLSIESGFPVHVNGSFSVYSNRRRLWEQGVGEHQSFKPFEAKWNEALMEDALVQAYLQLLQMLTSYNCKKYKLCFHNLWPNPTKVNYLKAWKPFLRSFFNKMIDEEWSLFYCNGNWRKLQDCLIVDSKLNKVTECIAIMNLFGENVISLPQDFMEAFKSSGKEAFVEGQMLTEDRFLREFFFPSVSKIPDRLRNSILVHILDRRLRKHRDYDDLLRKYPSFCCSKDGTLLRKPNELVHPKGKAACLFSEEEERFLHDDRFLEKERAMMLEELGMAVNFLPWCALCERAEWISSHCIVSKARLFIQYMNQMPPECEITSKETKILRAAKFLLVLRKPSDYPFSWKSGEYCTIQLADADHLYLERHKYLVGSSQLILDESRNSSAVPNKSIKEILGFTSKQPELSDAIAQLDRIIKPPYPLGREKKEFLCSTICEFLQKVVTDKKYKSQLPYLRQQLNCRPWILVKDQMVDPKHVAQNWIKRDASPYLFSLPFRYSSKFKALISWFGIKDKFSQNDFTAAILKFKKDTVGKKLTENEIRTLIILLQEVSSFTSSRLQISLPLPSVDCQLYNADELVINETPWYETDGNDKRVHEKIPAMLAYQCGAKELRKAELTSCSKPIGQPFGQHEKLTDRLKNILRAYPPDEGILKELLQNADDAKASEIHFIFDPRTHRSKYVFTGNWKDLQGPAVCVYNNKPFTKEDIEGIQKLGIGSKVNDPLKTGQYGIGFNAVYHLTDCPFFISNDEIICISDPHTEYVPGASDINPGRLYNQLDERFRRNYKDFLSGFLGDRFNLKGSTMFRLPLRRNAKLQSKISSKQWSDKEVRKLFDMFRRSAKDMLLFLNNVTKISVSEINNGKLETYSVTCGVSDMTKRTEFFEKIKVCSQVPTQQIEWEQACYVMKIFDTKNIKTEWLITQSLGYINLESDSQVPNGTDIGLLPRAGVALSMPSTESHSFPMQYSLFCVLPLPVSTRFPAHINGHFALDPARRGLWYDSKSLDVRVRWNDFMKRRVIAPAYAIAICQARKHILGCQAKSNTSSVFPSMKKTEDGLRWYHHFFPSIEDLDNEWKPAGEALYKNLLSMLYVLPVATSVPEWKKPSSEENPFQAETETVLTPVKVTWCKVSDAYFCTPGMLWSLEQTLLYIGFPLLSHTSSRIHESFKAVDSSQDVSPTEVRKFLHSHQKIKDNLPIKVQDTVLRDTNNVCELTEYCAQAEDFFENLQGLPLLLTQIETLRCFSSGCAVFCTRFSQLVPSRPDLFLHHSLIRLYTSNLEKGSDVMQEFLMSDLAKFKANLFPSSWINTASHQPWKPNRQGSTFPSREWLILLWEFIDTISSKKEYKSNVLEEIMSWHIIPTTHDCLVPVSMGKTVLNVSTHLNRDSTQDEVIRGLLLKLGCPQLNHTILMSPSSPRFGGALEVQKHYLAMVHSTVDVLGLLDQTFKDGDTTKDAKLQSHEMEGLLIFLQNTVYNLSRSSLRNLPFYQAISRNYTRLSDGKTVYEVPASVPGDDLEALSTLTSSIFLRQAPKLTELYQYIGVKQVSEVMFYIDIVLQHFNHLTPQGRTIHLKYVRDNILRENCDHYATLLSVLKHLPFIPDHSGIPRPAMEFYDPDNKVFRKFVPNEKFPPKPFDSKEWKEFLKKAGLQCAVTKYHFLQYAKHVEEEACNVSNPTSDGGKAILQRANVLVSHLFGNKSLQTLPFLSQISKIRFVPAAKITQLYLDIHPSPTKSILTCFSGSVIETETTLVWSSASLIPNQVFYHHKSYLAQMLGFHTSPPHELVMSHVKNISDRFPSMNKKEIPLKLQKALSEVMTKIYRYFRASCHLESGPSDANCSPNCQSTRNTLSNVPAILIDQHTFVRASQLAFNGVQYSMSPYMFNIPPPLKHFEHLLKCLGAQECPTPLQYSAVLEAIKRSCGDNQMHPGEVHVAVEATKGLFIRLNKDKKHPPTDGSPVSNATQSLENVRSLYLPTEEDYLMSSCDVFVNDTMEKKERLKDYCMDLLIDLTMRDQDPPPKLVELLPTHLKVKKLSSILNEELSPSCADKTCILDQEPRSCDFIKRYRNIICSTEFSEALIRLYKFQEGRADVTELVKADLRSLEKGVKILCMQNIQVRLVKIANGKPVEGSVSEVLSFYRRNPDGFFILIKHGVERNSSVLHERLSSFIHNITGQHIHEASWRYLMMILSVQHPSEISKTLDEARVPRSINSISREPKAGDKIPERFHDLLKNDIDYHLREGEWVGYEVSEEDEENDVVYIYAKIIKQTSQGDGRFAFNSKYKIDIGDTEPIEVSNVKLYKFDREESNAEGASSAKTKRTDLMPYEGETGDSQEVPGPREPMTLEEAKKEVAEALKEIWQLPESERSSAIKRLIRIWHPDKNKHRESFANEVTKFLLNELERLKKGGVPGYRAQADNSNQSSQRSRKESSTGRWRGPSGGFSGCTWDAPDFEQFFNRYRRRRERKQSHYPNGQNADNEDEPADRNEAQKWMRQAQEDLEASSCLFQNAHYSFTCFHCQQAVEKALKAVLFAEGRFKNSDLEAHDLLTLAYRVSGIDERLQAIPNMVASMHEYYIKTRYPNYRRGSFQSSIPARMFSYEDAEDAISKAEEILKLIQQVLH